MNAPAGRGILRSDGRVTNIELFFDLVFVFAVTQLSRTLVHHLSFDGAVQTAVLLAVVWQAWIYTTWFTTYVDPTRQPVRLVLMATMLGSLIMAVALPEAFYGRGMLFAATFVIMQVGRAGAATVLLRGHRLRMVFVRVTPWCVLSGAVMIVGAVVHGHARLGCWAAAIAIDLVGAAVGFYVPGLDRSATTDWAIEGSHFAERCQGFVLIALGESIVVTGSILAGGEHLSGHLVGAALAAFAGAVALWWVYFDRAAEDSAVEIARSDDPGRLGRSAFHWIHPLIVAGIIVTAAADEVVLDEPDQRGHASTTWLVLGGVALFLLGHALFKLVVWRAWPWTRLGGLAAAVLLIPVAPHVSAISLGVATVLVLVCVAIADRIMHPEHAQEPVA
jgi:low temperature requirement protein LtrA